MTSGQSRNGIMFVTFAPKHFSASRRKDDASSDRFRLDQFEVDGDKVAESIRTRVVSGRYVKLFTSIVRTRCKVVWVWGHDAAFVASIAAVLRPDLKLVWDISDVNQHLLGHGVKNRMLRVAERLLVKRANRLLLTSHRFYQEYYSAFVAQSRVRVVENRRSLRQRCDVVPPPAQGPLKIVFAGIFRSPEVLHSIGETAASLRGRVEFYLHGYANRSIPEDLPVRLAAEHDNVHLCGPYDAADIGTLYSPAHFVWGFVDPSENDNEKWLLSNRLYDAIVTGRPVITNANTASGDYVMASRLGIAVPMEGEAIAAALTPYLDPSASPYRDLLGAMPDPATGYMSGEYARVLEELLDD